MTRRTVRVLACTAVAAAGLVLGCESTDEASTGGASLGMVNDACPFTGRPVNDESPSAEYAGGTVGFCCGNCQSRWADMDDAARAAALDG